MHVCSVVAGPNNGTVSIAGVVNEFDNVLCVASCAVAHEWFVTEMVCYRTDQVPYTLSSSMIVSQNGHAGGRQG